MGLVTNVIQNPETLKWKYEYKHTNGAGSSMFIYETKEEATKAMFEAYRRSIKSDFSSIVLRLI